MSDRESQNFQACMDGLMYVGKALQSYTENGFKELHQDIYRQLASLPPCKPTDRCSEKHGGNVSNWCYTCKAWKNALKKEHRFSNYIQWGKTKSWTWPHNADNIRQVFVKSCNSDFDLRDISTLCHIWKNCLRFRIKKPICETTLRMRNRHFAHNPDKRVSDDHKAEMFDTLKDLVNERDFKMFIDVNRCREDLTKIENEETVTQLLNEIRKDTQANAKMTTHLIEQQKICNEHFTAERPAKRQKENRQHGHWGILAKYVKYSLPLILAIIIFWNYKNEGQLFRANRNNAECVSEVYRYPFPQDLPLLHYLEDREMFVGRHWLFGELNGHLSNSEHDSRGILIQAEMGYGKSAIVRQILCADHTGVIAQIREKVVAFHVCKFDVPSTWNIERFIHRLVGFFASRSAEFGSTISMLGEHALIFNPNKCKKEPIACFDQGIIAPLKKLNPDKPWVLAIDALDECFDSETNRNFVVDVLRYFPSWFKFIITSRDNYADNELRGMDRLFLNSSDKRNLQDIELFIEEQALFIEKRNSLPAESLREKFRKDVLKHSEGNFLFIVRALDYVMSRSEGMQENPKLPTKLTEIYEINFQRHFPTSDAFRVARLILQLVCTSLHPLSKNELTNIVLMDKDISMSNISQAFKSLRSFLSFRGGLSIRHQSIRDWLVDNKTKLFFISKVKGHTLLAKYLIQSFNANDTVDIVDLAIHVASSGKGEYKKIFKSMNIHVKNDTLHELILRSNSPEALDLILPFIEDVNSLNKAKETPAFIASHKGHRSQLELLVANGADLNFTKGIIHLNASSGSVFEIINLCETSFFCGFSLLHIAAKSGNINIVQYLLETNWFLVKLLTTSGHDAIDLACESGYDIVIKYILSLNRSMLGEKCLYLAAKNGHEHVIDLFLELKNVPLLCITDAIASQAYHSVVNIFSSKIIYNLKDVWWLVFKETPMHVAVRFGRYSTVVKLTQNQTQLLSCYDAFGRTPYLTSIWYNQTDIFKYLLKHINHLAERCSDKLPSHLSFFEKVESFNMVFVKDKSCPLGASFSHLVAKFDRFEMIKHVLKENIATNWSAVDLHSNTADFYAACAGSLHYLLLSVDYNYFGRSINVSRGHNGSTVYHVAASCAQVITFTVLLRYGIPNFFDNHNRSIMQYLAMQKADNHSSESQLDTLKIFNTLINFGHSLHHTDLYGRNVLHYILRYGHFLLVDIIYRFHKHAWSSLLTRNDFSGYTPFIFSLMDNNEIAEMHDLACLLNKTCDLQYLPVGMLLWERTLIVVMQLDHSNVRISYRHLVQLMKKSPYLTKAVIINLDLNENHLKRALEEILDEENGLNEVVELSLSTMLVHKPTIFYACHEDRKNSPIHKIFRNFKLFGCTFLRAFADHFGSFSLQKYLSCPDRHGYNVFHNALIGSNIEAAEIIMDLNVSITNEKVKFENIFLMVLFPHTQDIFVLNNYMLNADTFLTNLIAMNSHYLNTRVFCDSNAIQLSLVHLLSVNGLQKTLAKISEKYGTEILSCKNKDGLTPQYLWRILWDGDFFDKFSIREEEISYPNEITERMFLYKRMNNFSPSISGSISNCLFRQGKVLWHNLHFRLILKQIQCITKPMVEIKTKTIFFEVIHKFLTLESQITIVALNLRKNREISQFILSKNCSLNKFLFYLRSHTHYYKVLEKLIPFQKLKKTLRKIGILKRLVSKLVNNLKSCPVSGRIKRDIKRFTLIEMFMLEEIFHDISKQFIELAFVHEVTILVRKWRGTTDVFFWQRVEKLGLADKQWMGLLELGILSFYKRFRYLDIIRETIVFKSSTPFI